MVLPLSLIKTTVNHPILVELKNGEAYSGVLANCDNWMNLHLKDVVLTSKDGDKFWRLPEIYLRGNNIKYLRVPDEIIDVVKDEALKASVKPAAATPYAPRGGRGGMRGGMRGAMASNASPQRNQRRY
jgi:U6 snRNA-associated Sm-like protein LSm4